MTVQTIARGDSATMKRKWPVFNIPCCCAGGAVPARGLRSCPLPAGRGNGRALSVVRVDVLLQAGKDAGAEQRHGHRNGDPATELSKAWSEEYADGATSGVDLYRRKNQVSVMSPAAIAYSKAALSEEGQQKRAQFAPIMKEYSWKCVYSATDEEFEANWKYMVETAKSYGYDDVTAEYMADIEK